MENFSFVIIIALLVGTLFGIVLLKAANLSAVPIYFIVGLIVGPGGLELLQSGETVDLAAELGIILLLFTVGLQIDLRGLKSLQRFVFGLGGLQVGVTTAVVASIAAFYVDGVLLVLLIGFIAMMSPTAVISQILIEGNAINSPVGRRAMGILLFQDFLVIPLIILYSTGDIVSSLWPTAPLLALKIAGVLLFVFTVAPRLMRLWLDWVSTHADGELFVLNIVMLIAASALASGFLDLSFALGPFLVGILIAETPHRARVGRMIEPFRHLFLGFFFVTVGMLINPELFAAAAGLIFLLAFLMWAIKVPIVLLVTRAMGGAPATSWRTALLTGGGGPFGFVLLAVAKSSGILSDEMFQILVPANIIALVATPFVWSQSDRLVHWLCPNDWKIDARQDAAGGKRAAHLSGHIILCGFGATGQAAAGILRTQNPNFIALENNYEILESAVDSGDVIYGDACRAKSLSAAGIERAAVLNITFPAPASAEKTVRTARALNPKIHIIAKAGTARQAEKLGAAGADQILVESHQSGLSFAGQTLRRLGTAPDIAAFKRARFRDDPFFRGRFGGGEDDGGILSCRVATADVSLRTIAAEVRVVAWRRDGEELDISDSDGIPHPGDQIVMMGEAADLDKMKTILISGDG